MYAVLVFPGWMVMGRFWSVGGGGLLLMTDLKGHGCAHSLKLFKVVQSCKLSKLRAEHKNLVNSFSICMEMRE